MRGAVHNGLRKLIRERDKASSLCPVRKWWEAYCVQAGSGPLPGTKSADTLIMDFLASKTVGKKKKKSVVKATQSMEFCYSRQAE